MKIASQIFDWKDFGYDIHIGSNKPIKEYEYSNNRNRAEYFRQWYRKNRERHLKNVKAGQLASF